MLALSRGGRQAEALAHYRQLRARLADDLGIDASAALQDLHQRILTADPALTADFAVPPPLPMTDSKAACPAGAPEVRYSLPPDIAAFTGRADEVERVTAAVARAGRCYGGTVWTIGGMPGVGKTTLAVHVAHQLGDRFPDRQLFIDLHAHTPGQDPVPPMVALARLLTATGADARHLPDNLDGRAGLWRDRTAGQRALLVLDNAASSAQVAPLLPGGEDCLVLITSRRHLGDLPGALKIPLEPLPPGQAQTMFLRLAPQAADTPPQAARDLTRLAGHLPLAISLLARLLARHPSWTLADLLRETRMSPLTLAVEQDSVAAAFEISYQHLDTGQQQFFRRLGLHQGATTDASSAADLAGISLGEASRHLDALHGEGLLTEAGYRRYGMHDLIRRYARGLTTTDRATTDPTTADPAATYPAADRD
jgi:hypothetical protein